MAETAPRIIIDTNVIVSAIRSKRGASSAVINLIGTSSVRLKLSVALALEYEEVLKRDAAPSILSSREVDDLVAFMVANAERAEVPTGFWPLTNDADDQFLARLAIASASDFVITHNTRHLLELRGLGISVVTPQKFLAIMKNR